MVKLLRTIPISFSTHFMFLKPSPPLIYREYISCSYLRLVNNPNDCIYGAILHPQTFICVPEAMGSTENPFIIDEGSSTSKRAQ